MVKNGIPGTAMPPAGIADEDIWRIVLFIRAMRGSASETDVPGNVAQGAIVFAGKGGCTRCHEVNGKGGTIGPDLSNIGAQITLQHLREALTQERPVSDDFRPVKVVTRSGETVEGITKNRDSFSIQILDYNNRLHAYDTAELKEIVEGKQSLMPHNYDKVLSAEEYHDPACDACTPGTDQPTHEAGRRWGGRTMRRAVLLLLLGMAAPVWSQITDKDLKAPPGANWLHYNGAYDSQRFSPLGQITTGKRALARQPVGLSRAWVGRPAIGADRVQRCDVCDAAERGLRAGQQEWADDLAISP